MTKYKFEANERKQQRIIDANYTCQVCDKRFPESELQLAHRISDSKFNVKTYGKEVMYHDKMMVITCGKCNSSVLINRASNPIEAMELIKEIQADLADK